MTTNNKPAFETTNSTDKPVSSFNYKFDAKTEYEGLVKYVKDWFEDNSSEKNGKKSVAVVGISGGKDSAVAAKICVDALGKDRVIGIIMPYMKRIERKQPQQPVAGAGVSHQAVGAGVSHQAVGAGVSHQAVGANPTAPHGPGIAQPAVNASVSHSAAGANESTTNESNTLDFKAEDMQAELERTKVIMNVQESIIFCNEIGIKYEVLDITNLYDFIAGQSENSIFGKESNLLSLCVEDTNADKTKVLSEQAEINLLPRLRMTVLYAVAQSVNGRVINTSNLSERYVGWYTRWGDQCGDVSLFGALTCTEVIAIGKEAGVKEGILNKSPDDGVCGKTDEEKFGFTYKVLDDYLRGYDDSNKDAIKLIEDKYAANKFKLVDMNMYGRNKDVAKLFTMIKRDDPLIFNTNTVSTDVYSLAYTELSSQCKLA